MNEDIRLAAISADDCDAAVALFNHYVEHDFSAFPAEPVPSAFFGKLLEAAAGYPTVAAKTADGALAGFGLLRPHSPFPTFARTADATYFVAPDRTGQGIGSRMLADLENGARRRDIATLLAPISSLNERSLAFHRKHGFVEAGCLREVGFKKGRLFDVVWMQKVL